MLLFKNGFIVLLFVLISNSAFFCLLIGIFLYSERNLINAAVNAPDEPSPELPGVSEILWISIAELILNFLKHSFLR